MIGHGDSPGVAVMIASVVFENYSYEPEAELAFDF
jgi:hypothetical protein